MAFLSFPSTQWMGSAANFDQLPADEGQEIAFIGRSNIGKSSAINAITGNKSLARISKTPGCTRLFHFFQIAQQGRLVDLPGYGYARVSKATQNRWAIGMTQYLRGRHSLRGLILLIDSRHPLMLSDQAMLLNWQSQTSFSRKLHILLTKSDKASSSLLSKTLHNLKAYLIQTGIPASYQLFSARHAVGLQTARKQVLEWLS